MVNGTGKWSSLPATFLSAHCGNLKTDHSRHASAGNTPWRGTHVPRPRVHAGRETPTSHRPRHNLSSRPPWERLKAQNWRLSLARIGRRSRTTTNMLPLHIRVYSAGLHSHSKKNRVEVPQTTAVQHPQASDVITKKKEAGWNVEEKRAQPAAESPKRPDKYMSDSSS